MVGQYQQKEETFEVLQGLFRLEVKFFFLGIILHAQYLASHVGITLWSKAKRKCTHPLEP